MPVIWTSRSYRDEDDLVMTGAGESPLLWPVVVDHIKCLFYMHPVHLVINRRLVTVIPSEVEEGPTC